MIRNLAKEAFHILGLISKSQFLHVLLRTFLKTENIRILEEGDIVEDFNKRINKIH